EPERGQDLEHPISISFYDSLRGTSASFSLTRMHPCGTCNGSGQVPGSRETACSACTGTGKTVRMRGHLQFTVTCAECGGSGRMITPCSDCRGEGRVPGAERVNVEVPPGAGTGARIRIPGKGDAGRFGGPPTELDVVVPRVADERSKEILRELAKLNPENPRKDLC